MFRLICILVIAGAAFCGEAPISEWRVNPVVALPEVAFGDSAAKTADLLDQMTIDWENLDFGDSPIQSALDFSSKSARAYVLAATYLTADRYGKATLEVKGTRPLVVYGNGKELSKATKADSGEYKASSEVTLDRTRMEIVVASVSQSSDSGKWNLSAVVKQDSSSNMVVSAGARLLSRPAHFRLDSELEDYSMLTMSPDGKYLVMKRTIREGEEYKQKSRVELWDVEAKKPLDQLEREKTSGFRFSDDGKLLYYQVGTDEGNEVWAYTPATRRSERILSAVKDMGGFDVLPDGGTIVYAVSKAAEESKTGYELYQTLEDRVSTYDDRKELFAADLQTGVTRQLTKAGDFELSKWSVSPGGKRILLERDVPKLGRPYVTQEFFTLSLTDGAIKEVLTRNLIRYPQNFIWIDENTIAYSAGSHDSSPEDTVVHNSSQTVAYSLNLLTGEHRNLTGTEEFSIEDEGHQPKIFFNPRDKRLYFHVARGGEVQFASSNVDGKQVVYRPFKIESNFTDAASFAANGSKVAYISSDYNSPKAICVYDMILNRETKLSDLNAETTSDWEFGTIEAWNFTNRLGIEIDGWIYKPADFTPDRKWPTIVYYYAGVSPRDLRFSYTYQFWLANGYVVYVLNPVGAYGRGQKFADYHANDWGTEATADVIEGTEKLLAAHPYMDTERMGAYGGSYGGFITLDLATKSNLFKCAVDMYGISNITNYFGAGTWGYWYGEVAAPGSFPWTRKDIFVEKSPIFSADKITTPLLILHGASDNNVPPNESDQMFVALKLLGKDAVYAKFDDETHNINTKYKNLIEHRQMMLEWFDKYLKDQPGAWEARLEAEK
ncbi:S9 family peptidase [bacterium]|nr:S9 family peptidase [bacterium]